MQNFKEIWDKAFRLYWNCHVFDLHNSWGIVYSKHRRSLEYKIIWDHIKTECDSILRMWQMTSFNFLVYPLLRKFILYRKKKRRIIWLVKNYTVLLQINISGIAKAGQCFSISHLYILHRDTWWLINYSGIQVWGTYFVKDSLPSDNNYYLYDDNMAKNV